MRVANFIWFGQVIFVFYCSGQHAYINVVARCIETLNMTAFLAERKWSPVALGPVAL